MHGRMINSNADNFWHRHSCFWSLSKIKWLAKEFISLEGKGIIWNWLRKFKWGCIIVLVFRVCLEPFFCVDFFILSKAQFCVWIFPRIYICKIEFGIWPLTELHWFYQGLNCDHGFNDRPKIWQNDIWPLMKSHWFYHQGLNCDQGKND